MNSTRRIALKLAGSSILAGALVLGPLTGALAKSYPRKVPFSNSDAFDEALAQAMKEGFETIEVLVPTSADKALPARLRAWLGQVEDSGGHIRFRAIPEGAGRMPWVIAIELIVSLAGPYVVDGVRSWLRSAANDYHAVVVGKGSNANTATFIAVEFFRRGSSSWAEAIDQTRPMRLKR